MHDEAPPELSDLLDQIAFFLAQPLDFTSTDPETTETKVRILTAAAFYFNMLSVREFGGRLGAPRDHGLVEQVVAAAFQTFGGVDPHPGPLTKPRCCCGALPRAIPSTTATNEPASWSPPTSWN